VGGCLGGEVENKFVENISGWLWGIYAVNTEGVYARKACS